MADSLARGRGPLLDGSAHHRSSGPQLAFFRHGGIYRSDVVKTKRSKPEGGRRLPLVGPEPQSKDATGGNNRALLIVRDEFRPAIP
jgi:hypothetical protein